MADCVGNTKVNKGEPIRRYVLASLAALLLATATGCPETTEAPTADKGPQIPGDLRRKRGNNKDRRFILLVRLRMATIEVPLGTVSGSEELWSYLDEEPIRALRSATLGRNGIRIGIGRSDTWDDLAKVLKKMTGREVKHSTLGALPGDPLAVVLKVNQPAQTIFVSYEDRTLSGADYPPGENLLTFSFSLDEDDPSRAIITGVPQVRSNKRKTRYVRSSGGFRILNRPTIHTFRQLAFQLSVPNRNFLVIGPNAESRRETSVGHRFLVRRKKGVEYETVLILIPEIFAAPLKTKAP